MIRSVDVLRLGGGSGWASWCFWGMTFHNQWLVKVAVDRIIAFHIDLINPLMMGAWTLGLYYWPLDLELPAPWQFDYAWYTHRQRTIVCIGHLEQAWQKSDTRWAGQQNIWPFVLIVNKQMTLVCLFVFFNQAVDLESLAWSKVVIILCKTWIFL